jgi:hypothetical protein
MPALIAVSSSSPRAKNSRIVPLLPAPVTLCQMAFCSLDSARLRWMNVGPRRLRSFLAALLADTLATQRLDTFRRSITSIKDGSLTASLKPCTEAS